MTRAAQTAELEEQGRQIAIRARLQCLLSGIQSHDWSYRIWKEHADRISVWVYFGAQSTQARGTGAPPKSIATAEVNVYADGAAITARGGPERSAPRKDRAAGNRFHRELAELVKRCSRSHNPPIWVRDPDVWQKAKRRVLGGAAVPKPRHLARYKDPYALIAYWYRQMGGRTR